MEKPNSKSTGFDDSFESAKKAAYHILSYRDHSTHEVTKKLSAKGFSEERITQTLRFLREIQLLDDQKFARTWSRFRVEHHHYGPIRLRGELLKKGLPAEEVADLVKHLFQEYDPLHQIKTALTRRYKNPADLQEQKLRRRAFDYLLRKGHAPQAILSVFRKMGIMA